MRHVHKLRALVSLIGLTGIVIPLNVRAQLVYATTYQHRFGTLDLTTGMFTARSITPTFLPSITFATDGTLYGAYITVDSIDPLTGVVTRGSATGNGLGYYGMVRGGTANTLLGLNGGNSQLDNMDIPTAVGTSYGASLYPGQPGGGSMCYGPGGLLYCMLYADAANGGTDVSTLYVRDPVFGTGTVVNTFGFANLFNGLVYANGRMFGLEKQIGSFSQEIVDLTSGTAVDTGVAVTGMENQEFISGTAWEPGIGDSPATPEPNTAGLALSTLAAGTATLWSKRRKKR